MRILSDVFLRFSRYALLLPTLVWIMGGCNIRDSLDGCFYGVYVRVITSSQGSSDPNWMGEGTVEDVMLYVFDENEILLDMFPTEIGKTELLYYRNAKKLCVASAANIGDEVSFPALVPGTTTLSQVEIALKEAERYLDIYCYANPSDVFSGQIEIDNVDSEAIHDLPVRRHEGAVMVRVRGLREYLNATGSSDEDFAIVFGGKYNYLNLDGQAGLATRADGFPVPYKQNGGFLIASIDNREYFEAPKQVSMDKTDYFRVLALRDGMPASVDIYYKDRLVSGTPVTHDTAGNPLMVKNDLLNVIEIVFSKSGGISIRIREASWNSVVEIEKDFGNGDD